MTVPPIRVPGTTNLVTNPWFATNFSGWGATVGSTQSRTTEWSLRGPAAGQVARSGGSTGDILMFITVNGMTTGQPYTISAVIRNPGAVSRSVRLRYDSQDLAVQSLAAGEVRRISVVVTATSATSVGVGALSVPDGEAIQVGHVQVEPGSRVTAPCPNINTAGTIVAPDTWSGSAHASTSTRPARSLPGLLAPATPIRPLRIGKD